MAPRRADGSRSRRLQLWLRAPFLLAKFIDSDGSAFWRQTYSFTEQLELHIVSRIMEAAAR